MDFDIETARDAFNYFGLPIILLYFAGKYGLQGVRWVGEHIIVPLKDRLIKHVDHLDASIEQMSLGMAKVSDALEGIQQSTHMTAEAINGIQHTQEKHGFRLDRHEGVLVELKNELQTLTGELK